MTTEAEQPRAEPGDEDELATVQEALRSITRTRAERLQAGDQRGARALDEQLATLRERRQSLLDERFATTVGHPPPVPPPAARRRPRGAPLMRLLLVLVAFGVVATGLAYALVFVSSRLIVPAPIEGIVGGEIDGFEAVFEEEANPTIEQRAIGLFLALNRDRVARRPSDDPTPVSFVVEPGESAVSIAARLEEEGLIEDQSLFRRLLQYRGADTLLEAGTFQLARNLTMDEIILILQTASLEEVTITLPEGWRAAEMAAYLEEAGIVSADDYLALVNRPERFDDDFLADLPPDSSLEGYLFPDTYRLFREELTAETIIDLQLETFGLRVTPELRAAATARGITLHQAVTLASIVEREAVVAEERATIAGVYYNRWADGTVFNADPTIQYALGYQAESDSWWKRPLTLDDLAIDSPYNSYRVVGLPPSPIASPGLDALRATILAPPTDFYYFVSRNDGTHVFAVTYDEHLANVARFQSSE